MQSWKKQDSIVQVCRKKLLQCRKRGESQMSAIYQLLNTENVIITCNLWPHPELCNELQMEIYSLRPKHMVNKVIGKRVREK
jgi:hypothetical protein